MGNCVDAIPSLHWPTLAAACISPANKLVSATLFVPRTRALHIATDRVGCLFDKRLRLLLDHVLFAPGAWGNAASLTVDHVKTAPCEPEVLVTSRGILTAELERSPAAALRPLLRLLEDGLRLAVGDFRSSFVPVLLFLVRLTGRVLAHIRRYEWESRDEEKNPPCCCNVVSY